MLKNINIKNRNIIARLTPFNDSVHIQVAGFVAWTGWVLFYPCVETGLSSLKMNVKTFSLLEVPASL